MKTEAIRLCIRAQYGKKDYSEAREELNALLARITELEAAQQSVHLTWLCVCPEEWSVDIHGNCSNCGLAKSPRK